MRTEWVPWIVAIIAFLALLIGIALTKPAACADVPCPRVECWGTAGCGLGCPCTGWSPVRPGEPGRCG